jgi:hypothetical protein
LEDFIFWLGVTFLMFYFLLVKNNGEFRWFSLLGAGLGSALYFAAVSKWVVLVSVKVVEFIKKFIAALASVFFWPFKQSFTLLKKPAKNAGLFVRKNLRGAVTYGKIKMKKTVNQINIIRKKV